MIFDVLVLVCSDYNSRFVPGIVVWSCFPVFKNNYKIKNLGVERDLIGEAKINRLSYALRLSHALHLQANDHCPIA